MRGVALTSIVYDCTTADDIIKLFDDMYLSLSTL